MPHTRSRTAASDVLLATIGAILRVKSSDESGCGNISEKSIESLPKPELE
jgi:hypothetical protein